MEADLLWWNDSTASGEGANPNPRHLTRTRLRCSGSSECSNTKDAKARRPLVTEDDKIEWTNWRKHSWWCAGQCSLVAFPTPHSVDWSHCASPNSGCSQHRWLFVGSRCFKEDAERCFTEFQLRETVVHGLEKRPVATAKCCMLSRVQKAHPSIPAIRKPKEQGLKIVTDWITWTDLDIGFGAWTLWNWTFDVAIGSRQDAIFKRDPPTLGRDALQYQRVWRQRFGSNCCKSICWRLYPICALPFPSLEWSLGFPLVAVPWF